VTVRTHTLANAFEILCVERPGLPLIDLHLYVRAGADADPVDVPGRASMVAELLEEGAGERSGLEIANAIDSMGALHSVSAGWDAAVLAFHALAPRLDEALGLLADLAMRPRFPEAEVRRRREVRLASILQQRDEPAFVASRTFAHALYGEDHPYGRPPRGKRESVTRFDRAVLAAAHDHHYGAGRAFLIAVGDLSADALFRSAEAVFGPWNGPLATNAQVPAAPAARPEIVVVDRPGAPQSELRVGCAAVPRVTPDHAALVLLNTILGGAFTSRLNLRLREEKGYTYGARSRFSFRAGPGPFIIGTAVFTHATAEAVQDILHEVQRLGEELVPAVELERAKNYIVLGFPRRLETGSAIAAHLGELHLHGLAADELSAFIERVRAVDAEELRAVAGRTLDPGRMVVAIAGDRTAIEAPLATLGLADVRVAAMPD
jgi:zinc protease